VALEGNLRDFSLNDMFRLLESGKKTGILHMERPGEVGTVCFREGRVVFASSAEGREPMGRRLVRAGLISEKQLRQALGLQKIQKKEKADRRLGQILVDEGYLDAGLLDTFVAEQLGEALFDLYRWEEGELRFEPEEACGPEDIGITIPVDTVLADVQKRLEQWERIREKIPSADARFAISGAPGEKSVEIHLKPREWMLLCYLHGGRSVKELAEVTGYTDFETAKVLYGMYAAGLIEKAD